MSGHLPVMLPEVLQTLAPRDGATYLDGASSQDDLSVHNTGLSFTDYGSSTFDVPAFTPHDLGLSASGTPPSASSEPDNTPESEAVKSES